MQPFLPLKSGFEPFKPCSSFSCPFSEKNYPFLQKHTPDHGRAVYHNSVKKPIVCQPKLP